MNVTIRVFNDTTNEILEQTFSGKDSFDNVDYLESWLIFLNARYEVYVDGARLY